MDEEFTTSDESMIASLRKNAPDISTRVEFVGTLNKEMIAQVEEGILFVHAIWSGAAILSLRKLNEVVHNLDARQTLRVIATNTDSYDQQLELIPELTGKMHGNGEIVWIHDGKVVEAKVGVSLDGIEHATKRLLAMKPNA